jgi:glutamate 5-kinase
MTMRRRIHSHISLQALAAVGQGRLIALWDNLFGQFEQPIAQVLLTRGDIADVRSGSEYLIVPLFNLVSSARGT